MAKMMGVCVGHLVAATVQLAIVRGHTEARHVARTMEVSVGELVVMEARRQRRAPRHRRHRRHRGPSGALQPGTWWLRTAMDNSKTRDGQCMPGVLWQRRHLSTCWVEVLHSTSTSTGCSAALMRTFTQSLRPLVAASQNLLIATAALVRLIKADGAWRWTGSRATEIVEVPRPCTRKTKKQATTVAPHGVAGPRTLSTAGPPSV